MESEINNRRTDERSTFFTEVLLESAAGRRLSRISDLSLGGCYIECVTNFRVGESVSFEIPGPSGQPILFSGEVAYFLDGFGFGLTFKDLGQEQVDFLRRSLPV